MVRKTAGLSLPLPGPGFTNNPITDSRRPAEGAPTRFKFYPQVLPAPSEMRYL